jgi:hypothetical protein
VLGVTRRAGTQLAKYGTAKGRQLMVGEDTEMRRKKEGKEKGVWCCDLFEGGEG